jgi:hypothetical protein
MIGMKTIKTLRFAIVAVALAGVGALAAMFLTQTSVQPAPRVVAAKPAPVVAPPKVSAPEPSPVAEGVAENVSAPEPAPASEPPKSKPQPTASTASGAPANGRQLQDPEARDAMALVGADPEAEAYWVEAINDPTLSDSEREDLIEDLNESGFSDGNGKRATAEDLWLIERRIAIVEDLWAYAMDENNAKSFAEVYKDLNNMYDRLSQQVSP